MNNKRRSLLFMLTNLAGKSMAALSQLYAIFVFSRIHTPHEASIIFVLLGYAIWFQVFEFGIAQALQNRLNSRKISLTESTAVILMHYFGMLLFAVFVILIPESQQLLLPSNQEASRVEEIEAFSIGMALMIIATNNVIVQRVLIVTNRGVSANALLLLQSLFSMASLTLYHEYGEPGLLNSVLSYLAPAILVYAPIVISMARKLILRWRCLRIRNLNVISDAAGFWGLSILSSIFLGADYYFAAHYLSSEEIVSYHFSARFFFFSYVAYFAYVQHQAKNLTPASLDRGAEKVRKILWESVFIGVISVSLVLGCVVALDRWQFFAIVASQRLVVTSLVLAAGSYYLFRVFRDVGLVILWNLGDKSFLYKIYLLEIALGVTLLWVFAKEFAGIGIFLAMALTSSVSASIIFFVLNKMLSVHQNCGNAHL